MCFWRTFFHLCRGKKCFSVINEGVESVGDVQKSLPVECRKNDVIDPFDKYVSFNRPDRCLDDPNL